MSSALHVERFGSGPPVVLVHGSLLSGEYAFAQQRPLAERWTLIVPSRVGHRPGDDGVGNDYEVDAPLVAELLGDGAHLVGHSYGGVVALLAAAQRPAAVRSLALVESAAYGLAADVPAVRELVERRAAARRQPTEVEFLREYLPALGMSIPVPDELPQPLLQGARAAMRGREPAEAEIELDPIAAAGIPVLVITGGHSDAYEAVARVLTERLDAEHVVLEGASHMVPSLGEPFNEKLERLWRAAEP